MNIPGFACPARKGTTRPLLLSFSFIIIGLWFGRQSNGAEPKPLPDFERVVIDDNFPGAYQVEVVDVNGDGKLDIVALGGGTCAWYENPTWKKRIVTNPKQTPGLISTATADLDGDGKAEIAIAYEFSMNQPTKGKLLLAHPGKELDAPWTLVQVADVGSIHRLRWMIHDWYPKRQQVSDLDVAVTANRLVRSRELVVAPLFGPSAKPPVFAEEPAHLILFSVILPRGQANSDDRSFGGLIEARSGGGIGGGGGLGGRTGVVIRPLDGLFQGDRLAKQVMGSLAVDPRPRLEPRHRVDAQGHQNPFEIGSAPVLHAIDLYYHQPKNLNAPLPIVFAASNFGVTLHTISGIPDDRYVTAKLVPGAPGEAPKQGASEVHTGRLNDGRLFLATVEPWHGTDVSVYIAETLLPMKFGSRTVIDSTLKEGHALWVADVDGDGDDEIFAGYRGKGTSLIGYDFDGKSWNRTVLDTAIAAQDLRGGDIDGDGTPDFVGVGGSTHNVVWYRPKKN